MIDAQHAPAQDSGGESPGPLDARHFTFVSIADAATPLPGSPKCYVDHYWLVDDQDRIGFHNPAGRGGRCRSRGYGSPQGNTSEVVAKLVGKKYPWCTRIQLVPVVFAPMVQEEEW